MDMLQEMIVAKMNASHIMTPLLEPIKMTMESFSWASLLSTLGIVLTAACYYWVFYIPINWQKALEDVSYDLALGRQRNIKPKQKREAINRMRRIRKTGNNEIPPPFPNGWYNIAESSSVIKGEAISIACLGEQFVVYRTASGEVNVLDAYCPHLGANLGIGGKVVGDNIECPFHQWAFRGSDGQCVNVPYSSCGALLSSKLRKWISKESHDFIFLWYHAENEEPWELPIIEEIASNEFVYHGRNEFIVNCHIQEIPENGADLAHFTAVHNTSVLAGGSPSDSSLTGVGTHHWNANWQGSKPSASHISTLTLNHSLELLPKLRVCDISVSGLQIGPAYVQLHMTCSLGRFVAVQSVTPIEPLVQRVTHRFYGPRILAPFMKFCVVAESIMVERDINIWNHKTFRNNPHLVKEELPIKSFRSWYNQFYTDNSKTFAHAQENLDW